jgi:hypothetical protein
MAEAIKEKKEKEFITNAKPKIDLKGAYENPTKKVKFQALDGAKHHTPGKTYEGSEVLVRTLEKLGHAKRI